MSNDEALERVKLGADQRDALQEIVNIGMGMAGERLASILHTFVELSIPNITAASVSQLPETLARLVKINTDIIAVRQAFFSHWRGETITVFGQQGCKELASLMGYPENLDIDSETELLLDVSNVLVGACMNGIATQLGIELKFSPPSLLTKNGSVLDLFETSKMEWTHTLLMEVNFKLENMNFVSHLIIMMSEESIATLCKDLDKFLENL